MSQQHSMAMGSMGGPVGGLGAPPMNAGTPTNSAGTFTSDAITKKLNTAIYDYLLCNEKYDVARLFQKEMLIEFDIKNSPGQRTQSNGIDSGMDIDKKEHPGIQKRPSDLQAPHSLSSEDSPFLLDWWCQFWELYQGNRQKGKPTTLSYVGQQRQSMKARTGMVSGTEQNGMRPTYNMMNNGMGGENLRHAAMKNGMTAQQMQAVRQKAALQGNQMQGGNQMERQGSQMNMSDPRSGSPNTGGEAPSPKRQRLDGNMQQANQARGGQPGQMQGANQSVEVYSQAMQQQMQTAIQRANSNVNKGMPPNPAMGPGGAQSSPMQQQGMDASTSDFQYNTTRMGIPQNSAATANQQAANGGGGNHALQDYQMQLMLLEQQNKKRLLMARQEQDSMAHPSGVPGPNGVGRGSPQTGMLDPNMNPQIRAQLMLGPSAQNGIRAPSSHPMTNQQLTPQQMEMLRQQGMINGAQWPQGGHQAPPGQMMPGHQHGQGGPPGQTPTMTPRQGHMPPPPAPPTVQGGTQPSSPAQLPAPPTPSQTNKSKPVTKKGGENKKGAANQKKGNADAQTENAPTPTPPPPVTPSNAPTFNQNKNAPMQNGQPTPSQQPNHSNGQPNAVQPPSNDMNVASFSALDGPDQFSGMDFANLDSGDVLDNFDFDSFLNNPGGDDTALAFDANFAFGDGGIEADIGGN